MEDVLALILLDHVYDVVEDRFGKAAAWIVTGGLAAAVIATLVWIALRFLAA